FYFKGQPGSIVYTEPETINLSRSDDCALNKNRHRHLLCQTLLLPQFILGDQNWFSKRPGILAVCFACSWVSDFTCRRIQDSGLIARGFSFCCFDCPGSQGKQPI